MAGIASTLALLALACPPSRSIGEAVAVLELAAPQQREFVLHATLPVPPGTHTEQAPAAFVLTAGEGSFPAQVETLTRYPRPPDGADVVELWARVRLPGGTGAGERVTYRVLTATPSGRVERGSALLSPGVVAAVDQLLSPGSLILSAADRDLREHRLDLLTGVQRVIHRGPVTGAVRIHGVMLPSGEGLLPHLFGVHAYVRTFAKEPFVALDLRVHGGLDGLDPTTPRDDALDRTYFDGLRLSVPEGWNVLSAHDDTALGKAFRRKERVVLPLVRREDDGHHVLPRQGQLQRRLVLYPDGTDPERARAIVEHHGLAFATPAGEWSWWSEGTARFAAQKQRLPELAHLDLESVRAKHAKELRRLERQLEKGRGTGSYPFPDGALGWAHPYGVRYKGMSGGAEIHFFEGVDVLAAASLDGYRALELVHRMQTDRHPVALFALDGDPTRLADVRVRDGASEFVPANVWLTVHRGADPFGFSRAPNRARFEGAPEYEATLRKWQPHDLQHLVRYTRTAKALAWIGGDRMAIDDLLLQAELFRLSYHPLPNNARGMANAQSMLEDLRFVDEHPGRGFGIGRAEGWGMDAMAASYALADEDWRGRSWGWFNELLGLLEKGQVQCSGFLQAHVHEKNLGGRFRTRQAFEQAILEHGMAGVLESVYRDASPPRARRLEAVLQRSLQSWLTELTWGPDDDAPWTITAVGPIDPREVPYCAELPDRGHSKHLDRYHVWNSLALGYRLTGVREFLAQARRLAGGELLPALRAGGLDGLPNRAALLALAQSLAER